MQIDLLRRRGQSTLGENLQKEGASESKGGELEVSTQKSGRLSGAQARRDLSCMQPFFVVSFLPSCGASCRRRRFFLESSAISSAPPQHLGSNFLIGPVRLAFCRRMLDVNVDGLGLMLCFVLSIRFTCTMWRPPLASDSVACAGDRHDCHSPRSYRSNQSSSMSIYGNNCLITSILLPLHR